MQHGNNKGRGRFPIRVMLLASMRRIWFALAGHLVLAGCQKGAPEPAPPARPSAVAPVRGAVGDTDLRVLLSELASSKACDLIRGGFQALRAPEHPDVVTGVLWIRECRISNVGTHATFRLGASGWLWVHETKRKAGGTFTVHQYVRFNLGTTIEGAFDIFYDSKEHVVTLWFTPDNPPEVEFKTIGGITIDSEGVWSSAVAALGSAFSSSYEDLARTKTTAGGTKSFNAQLAEGLAVTINLCTGLRRTQLGHPPIGQMSTAGVGETLRVAVEVKPDGVIIIGPQDAHDGMTVQADAEQGEVRLSLVCAKQAEAIADAFMSGRVVPPEAVLAKVDVHTTSKLEIGPATCPVVVVATPLSNAPARFAWERPAVETARSTGGPLVDCEAKPKSPMKPAP